MGAITSTLSSVGSFLSLAGLGAAWSSQLFWVIATIIGSSFFFPKGERKGKWGISVSVLAIVEAMTLLFK
jgi:hypothetical protein